MAINYIELVGGWGTTVADFDFTIDGLQIQVAAGRYKNGQYDVTWDATTLDYTGASGAQAIYLLQVGAVTSQHPEDDSAWYEFYIDQMAWWVQGEEASLDDLTINCKRIVTDCIGCGETVYKPRHVRLNMTNPKKRQVVIEGDICDACASKKGRWRADLARYGAPAPFDVDQLTTLDSFDG